MQQPCRGVGRYEIVVGHTLGGGTLCYQTTKKWWGMCPQAPPMVTRCMLLLQMKNNLFVNGTLMSDKWYTYSFIMTGFLPISLGVRVFSGFSGQGQFFKALTRKS